MLIDDVVITVTAGRGGRGSVTFNKNMMSLGPVGGTGGNGGSIYAEGTSDISALKQFRFKKEIEAENGQDGRDQFRDGHRGEDIVLKLPVGTVVHNLTIGHDTEILKIGERVGLARGGKGGRGNFHFRSATNTSPKEFEEGKAGESFELRLEIKFIADIGFVGLPNVGKSSMLNMLTRAQAKVANYPFTTLEPNLGVYYELILADIPGLIEGSSTGKGLGHKFLRHIERTKVLFHFISAESHAPAKDYETIRHELGAHNPALLEKPEHLFLTKTDLVNKEALEKHLKALKKLNLNTIPISIHDSESIKTIQKLLNVIKAEK